MLALPFGAAPGTSQGLPGPFSFKRLPMHFVERTAQLINRSSPRAEITLPIPQPFPLHQCAHCADQQGLALPSGFMSQMGATITHRMNSTSPLWCSAISPLATMRSRTTFGSSTPSVICRTICRREGCFAANVAAILSNRPARLHLIAPKWHDRVRVNSKSSFHFCDPSLKFWLQGTDA